MSRPLTNLTYTSRNLDLIINDLVKRLVESHGKAIDQANKDVSAVPVPVSNIADVANLFEIANAGFSTQMLYPITEALVTTALELRQANRIAEWQYYHDTRWSRRWYAAWDWLRASWHHRAQKDPQNG